MQNNYLYNNLINNVPNTKAKEECFLQPFPPFSSFYGNFLQQNSKIQVSNSPNIFLNINHDHSFYGYATKEYNKLNKSKQNNAIIDAVTNTVLHFLGETNHSTETARLMLYYKNNLNCPITEFYNKDISQCSERAVSAHNLFQFFGLSSYLVSGPVEINGTQTQHHYNIVKLNEHYHIYDLACCPTKNIAGKITKQPLVKTLSEQEALKIGFEKEQFDINLNELLEPITFKTASQKQYIVSYGTSYHKEQSFIK